MSNKRKIKNKSKSKRGTTRLDFRDPETVCEYRADFSTYPPRRSCLRPAVGAYLVFRPDVAAQGIAPVFSYCDIHGDDLADDLDAEFYLPLAFLHRLDDGWEIHPSDLMPDAVYSRINPGDGRASEVPPAGASPRGTTAAPMPASDLIGGL